MQTYLVLLPIREDGSDISINPAAIEQVKIDDHFNVTVTMQSGVVYEYKIENIERRLAYYMDPPERPSSGNPRKAMSSKQAHEYLRFQERRRLSGWIDEPAEKAWAMSHLRRWVD